MQQIVFEQGGAIGKIAALAPGKRNIPVHMCIGDTTLDNAAAPGVAPCDLRHADELFVYINDWTKQRTRAEIEKIIADEFRQAYSPVLRVSEVIENEQFLARDMIVDMEGPDVGKYKMQGIPIKMMATPGEVRTSAPVCGQDNNDILKELGRTEEEIAALKEHGVI